MNSIRKELVYSTSALFIAAVIVAIASAAILLPVLDSPLDALMALTLIVWSELVVLFFFLRSVLDRAVLRPVDRIVEHSERIAGGDLEHRIPEQEFLELDRIIASVNTLASHLIHEKQQLTENVVSLNQTNHELTVATQELVRAARLASVGTLAAGVAHEIGNPLGALRGYLDVVRGRAAAGRDVSEVLDGAQTELERIDAIVRHILAFGQTEAAAGAQPLSDPRQVLEGVLTEIRSRRSLDEELLRLEAAADLPLIRAHPRIIERVVTNLVENALAAGRDSGSLAVEVRVRTGAVSDRHVPLKQRRTGDSPDVDYSHRRRLSQLLKVQAPPPPDAGPRTLVLEVLDRGPGVAEEDFPRIFDPFFTTRGVGEGSGVGLALVARMVGELGGEVEAENRDGGGALFRVHLPGIEPSSTPAETDDERVVHPTGERAG